MPSPSSSSRHPNITGGVAFHTWSGVLLRPFDHLADDEMHAGGPVALPEGRGEGHRAHRLSGDLGLPRVPLSPEAGDRRQRSTGSTSTSACSAGWSRSGARCARPASTNYQYIDWFRDHPIADDLKLYRWSTDKLGGLAHVAWQPFDHPQLGRVEIGGWNRFHAFGNPPPAFLERELARFPKWLVWQALTSPKMELVAAEADALGDGHWRVRLVVQNTGWLPSYVSKRALERKVVRGRHRGDRLPEGATLVHGKRREELGQLEGKSSKHTGVSFWPDYNVTDDRAKIEWVVKGKRGDRIRLVARHDRAGTVRADVMLG